MKFVENEPKVVTAADAIDLNPKKDQLDVEEIKPAATVKTIPMVTMTLVNMRKTNNKTAPIVTTIKGGETVDAETNDYGEFKKVKYNRYEGYINKKYLR